MVFGVPPLLDPSQRAAVEASPTPLVIIAGAGSGKTRVLTSRIARQLTDGVMRPRDCFVTSFTRVAAKEMEARLHLLTSTAGLTVGTFHRHAFTFLRQEWALAGQDPLEICRDAERKRVIRDLLGPAKPEQPHAVNLDADLSVVCGQISAWKANLVYETDEPVREAASSLSIDLAAAGRIYPLYQAWLAAERKLDFDDMLSDLYALLIHDEAALERISRRWNAFFIDEGQDINRVQWELLKLIAPPGTDPNLTIVGDPRQAIYQWRSATPAALLGACDLWGAQRIDLVTNYRSLPPIVGGANRLISPLQLPNLVPARTDGPQVVPVLFEDTAQQAAEIVRLVGAVRAQGMPGSSVAVLVRTNAQTAAIERAFTAAGLLYFCRDGGAFGRLEARDLLSYLRVAVDPTDRESLRRIINRPTRYLGEAFVTEVAGSAGDGGDLVGQMTRVTHTAAKALNSKQIDSAAALAGLIRSIGSLPPGLAIETVLARTGYLSWLRRHEGSAIGADEDRVDNLRALIKTAGSYATIADLIAFVDEHEAMLRNSPDATVISTVHGAKGSEWPVVIIAGMSTETLPHKRAVEPDQVDEERRVAYVAATRAQDLLVLCSPLVNDRDEDVDPSPFLADMGLAPLSHHGPLWSLMVGGRLEEIGLSLHYDDSEFAHLGTPRF